MFRTAFLLVAILGMASLGCKKEPIVEPPCCDTIPEEPVDLCCETIVIPDPVSIAETVYPSKYLATHPGNWWKYSNGTTDSCYHWEETSIYNRERVGDTIYAYEDRKVLPKVRIRNQEGYIMGGSFVTLYSENYTKLNLLVTQNLGTLYEETTYSTGTDHYGPASYTDRMEVSKLDSVEVSGVLFYDIILVHDYHRINYDPATRPVFITDRYYAKNIGLIKSEITSPLGPHQQPTIIDYHIN